MNDGAYYYLPEKPQPVELLANPPYATGKDYDAACGTGAWLADAVDDLPLFRRSDPPTSKAAGRAAREFLGDHERRILEALAAGPGTKDEISARCGLTEQMVIRRMARLRRIGRVVSTGKTKRTPSGCKAEVWRAA